MFERTGLPAPGRGAVPAGAASLGRRRIAALKVWLGAAPSFPLPLVGRVRVGV